MSQLGFTFDINKCVGCQACQIACSIENDLGYDFSWREINTYNPEQIDALPHYHLSLACNHCQEPICLFQCPAKAFTKSSENGIVIIEEDKCIGCKFCSWVCPYDAPKYNTLLNVMTKCTLCAHRIEEELEPACVSICPTDALNITSDDEFRDVIKVAGFPESEIKPCIHLEPHKLDQQLPEQYTLPYSNDIIDQYSKNRPQPKNKISLANDWTLVVFTFLISILGGWLSTALFSNNNVNPFMFGLIGLVGMGLSALHLGKKIRAYRALLNWRSSWLSREVLFFSMFLSISAVYLFMPEVKWLGFIALGFGLLTAISADNVYHVIAKENKKFFHSAQVWLTMLFFICFFNMFIAGVLIIGSIKLILYLRNKLQNKIENIFLYFLLFIRISTLVCAIILLLQNYLDFAFIIAVVSELVDRIEFYINLKIITPQNHMYREFQKDIHIQIN